MCGVTTTMTTYALKNNQTGRISSRGRAQRPAPSERSNRLFMLVLYAVLVLGGAFFLGAVYAILNGDVANLSP